MPHSLMQAEKHLSRRHFLTSSSILVGLAALPTVIGCAAQQAVDAKSSTAPLAVMSSSQSDLPQECFQHGFAICVQSWCFNEVSVFEAIERAAKTGVSCIELFEGQRLSITDAAALGPQMSDAQIQALQAQLQQHHIKLAGIFMSIPKEEAAAKPIFEFAKRLQVYSIVTESVDSIDTIEKMVKIFDIHVGFHEHMHNPAAPQYKNWDPHFILSVVKDRDARIGACADVGHWASSNIRPLDAIKILKGRVISLHLKDRMKIGEETQDVAGGTGILEFPAVLKELKAQGFKGQVSIEFENNWGNNIPDIAQYAGFVRGVGATLEL